MTDRRYLTWDEVYDACFEQAARFIADGSSIYGIPRGGMHIAGIMRGMGVKIASAPEIADVIVDDIIDSGKTAMRWRVKYDRPVWGLVTRKADRDWAGLEVEQGWVIFPWEDEDHTRDAEDIVRRMLQYIGEDPTRPGLVETPARVVRSWGERFKGYDDTADGLLKMFDVEEAGDCDEIIAAEIPFTSSCEHHLLPFSGTARVSYIPEGKVIGISKLARLVDMHASRLQVQERLTAQIADAVCEAVGNAEVHLTASHGCVEGRGIKAHGMTLTTHASR